MPTAAQIEEREELEALRSLLLQLHDRIRDAVVSGCESQTYDELSRVVGDGAGDTTFAVDRISEALLVDAFERFAQETPLVLIAEGVGDGLLVLPRGSEEADARWRIIMDPIDGTRGLMYQKRSAWVLTGVAPNRGRSTSLRDILLAVQTEIPLVKQHLCDQISCIRGEHPVAERIDRLSKVRRPLDLAPSKATDLAYGYATISRFFPGGRALLAAVDDDVAAALLGPPSPNSAHCFEDQYICSGGQLYELMAGHDRFVADLRPLLPATSMCCHPYDVCTLLIAEALGVIVTDAGGRVLDVPLDVTSEVAWLGYANPELRGHVEPALRAAMARHGLSAP